MKLAALLENHDGKAVKVSYNWGGDEKVGVSIRSDSVAIVLKKLPSEIEAPLPDTYYDLRDKLMDEIRGQLDELKKVNPEEYERIKEMTWPKSMPALAKLTEDLRDELVELSDQIEALIKTRVVTFVHEHLELRESEWTKRSQEIRNELKKALK